MTGTALDAGETGRTKTDLGQAFLVILCIRLFVQPTWTEPPLYNQALLPVSVHRSEKIEQKSCPLGLPWWSSG